MKRIIRTYLDGCKWCGATGFVQPVFDIYHTSSGSSICPVCNGSKIVLVTETIDEDSDIIENIPEKLFWTKG